MISESDMFRAYSFVSFLRRSRRYTTTKITVNTPMMAPTIRMGRYSRIAVAPFLLQLLQVHHFPVGRGGCVQLVMGSHCRQAAFVDE